jgi:hypothetical protein
VRKVQLSSARTIRLSGLTSPRGDEWIKAKYGKHEAYARHEDFKGSGGAALARLADGGVVIIGSDWRLVQAEVAQLRRFPPRPLIEQPGWSGVHFCFPDGTVISPKGAQRAIVLFAADKRKCVSAGVGFKWRDEVCKPLAGQNLCMFMVMTTFAALLLESTDRDGNFGYEIIGVGGIGKTTLQQLMATVGGGGLPNAPGRYWVDCNTTIAALETAMVQHSDQPLILEEAALYASGESRGSRAAKMRELIFKLSRGTTRARFEKRQQTEHRFVYVMATNKGLGEVMAGEHRGETAALADRLIPLRLDARPHGIFDFVPKNFESASEFAVSLKIAAAENYGLALKRFVRRLVASRAKDEAQLKRRVERFMLQFRKAAGVDLNDGSELRVADAFGLSYAAGMLAQRFKVLPEEFDCLAAAAATYRLYQEEPRFLLELRSRLRSISDKSGVIDLDKGLPTLSRPELHNVPAFVRTAKNKRREILFTQAGRDRFFPDFDILKRDPENHQWFKSEQDRDTVRRHIRAGKDKEPVYRFFLPEPRAEDPD